MADSRIKLGKRGESAASKYLQSKGYRLLQSNHRTRRGEADLILLDGDTLVFCEVKTKRSTASGHAAESYGPQQQKRLRNLVLRYLQKNGWEGPVRIDFLALQRCEDGDRYEIHHFPNALALEDSW